MDIMHRIFTKTIFGWFQEWKNAPCKESKNVKCVEYIRKKDIELTAKDIETIEFLIEKARSMNPDYSIYPWVAAEFNRLRFTIENKNL